MEAGSPNEKEHIKGDTYSTPFGQSSQPTACNVSITPLQCGLRPPLQQELGETYYEADLDRSAGEAEVMQVFTKLQQQKCTFITACHQVTVVQTLCQQRHRLRPSITQS